MAFAREDTETVGDVEGEEGQQVARVGDGLSVYIGRLEVKGVDQDVVVELEKA